MTTAGLKRINVVRRLSNSCRLARRSGFHYFRNAMLRPPYWLVANGQSCRVFADTNSGAASCYSEVVVQDCYGVFPYSKQARPRVIVDIGANLGVFSKLCSMLFPDADIYAYEPNPTSLDWLERNAAGTRIRIIPAAVGEFGGSLAFDPSFDPTLGHVSENGKLRVNCVAAGEVAEGRPIDLLKMDCEGSEWSILRDRTLLDRTQEFRLEYHLFRGQSLEELYAIIRKSGHSVTSSSETREDGKCGVVFSSHTASRR